MLGSSMQFPTCRQSWKFCGTARTDPTARVPLQDEVRTVCVQFRLEVADPALPSRHIGRRWLRNRSAVLGRVAPNAERLTVVEIVRAAIFQGHDVIPLDIGPDWPR